MLHVTICSDNTLSVPVRDIAAALNRVCRSITFSSFTDGIRIKSHLVVFPETYKEVDFDRIRSTANADYVFLFTNIPYDNNHFYITNSKNVIVSSSDWNLLTSLPLTNGVLYFIATYLNKHHIKLGSSHDNETGCINDYRWDKSSIDVAMRAAFVCDDCRRDLSELPSHSKEIFADIESILDLISRASRRGLDVVPVSVSEQNQQFDLFLCHNGQEKARVRTINQTLKKLKVRTWLDEEQIGPGKIWQQELEKAILSIKAAAVFVGNMGLAPWQNFEI